jgi:predicted nucleic acid-binding protein
VKVAVTDASIFIDLIQVGWIKFLPGIDCEIVTTYEVIAELHDWQQVILEETIQEQGFSVHPAPERELSAWRENLALAKRLSRPDITVLWLAVRMEAMVLTGDKLMRTASTRLHLETHGILWLFDQFIEKQLVTPLEACVGLEVLMEINDRLPREDCEDRLVRWKK